MSDTLKAKMIQIFFVDFRRPEIVRLKNSPELVPCVTGRLRLPGDSSSVQTINNSNNSNSNVTERDVQCTSNEHFQQIIDMPRWRRSKILELF